MSLLRILLILFLVSSSAHSGEIRKEAFFQALVGEWKGTGSLANSDGEETRIEESWKGEFRADDTFVMEGKRKWGEEDQDFRWVYSFNPTSEQFECLYWHTGIDEPIRFEVSLTPERVEMRTPLGDPGSELFVSNEKTKEGLAGEVKLTGSDGQVQLSGKLTHVKEK